MADTALQPTAFQPTGFQTESGVVTDDGRRVSGEGVVFLFTTTGMSYPYNVEMRTTLRNSIDDTSFQIDSFENDSFQISP